MQKRVLPMHAPISRLAKPQAFANLSSAPLASRKPPTKGRAGDQAAVLCNGSRGVADFPAPHENRHPRSRGLQSGGVAHWATPT